ncbi:SDR family oxidoreductase [Rudanella paleaurantiibacter]|uniref:SDR family oxidoreductase n=1 Tax=Rudanella paleaurantiibacter TaxID=2614655 RepID=A0A7J5U0T9_9BACT|nr:SDR family oxidoreductase [Rudanella paleaurantiibacter]KAB7731265.1 SDR family oxidoreductase [Rudanella paleaurantiibacter]
MNNKVVWITGASSGIGEALALELARRGARLVLSARREDELRRVANATNLPPTHVLVLPLDMTDLSGMAGHVQTVLDHFGQIDYVFQNAGITQRGSVAETQLPVYRQLMELNYFGVVALTQAVLPHMLRRGQGHFVVTSSVAGKIGTKQRSGYCASKHALHGFFDALRAEIAEAGLRVTTICPGYIRTPISLHALDAQGQKHARMDANQDKGMDPAECARQICQAVARGRDEVYVGGIETLGIYLARFWPALVRRIVRNRAPE